MKVKIYTENEFTSKESFLRIIRWLPLVWAVNRIRK